MKKNLDLLAKFIKVGQAIPPASPELKAKQEAEEAKRLADQAKKDAEESVQTLTSGQKSEPNVSVQPEANMSVQPEVKDDDVGPPPGAKVNAPKSSGSGGSGISSSRANYAPEVKNMQESIKQFAKAVTSYSKTQGQTSSVDQGKKAFNDFITEGFMSDKPVKGVEWTTDKSVTQVPEKQKTETGLFEMDVVIDGLNRIGGPNSEIKVDGIWGPRTTNALTNIIAFAKALMDIDEKFTGKTPTDFSPGNLAYLEAFTQIKGTDWVKSGTRSVLASNDKIFLGSIAQNLADTIKALTAYYTNFLQRTLSNPRHAIFIQQDKPLDNVKKKSEKTVMSESDKELLSKIESDPDSASINVKLSMPDGMRKTYKLNLFNLTTKERFKAFCESINIRNNESMVKLLNEIKTQVKDIV